MDLTLAGEFVTIQSEYMRANKLIYRSLYTEQVE